MLTAISAKAGDTEVAISVVTLIELAHGAARADTPQRKVGHPEMRIEWRVAMPKGDSIHDARVRRTAERI
jgi:predicted nucleic acid-binding protein